VRTRGHSCLSVSSLRLIAGRGALSRDGLLVIRRTFPHRIRCPHAHVHLNAAVVRCAGSGTGSPAVRHRHRRLPAARAPRARTTRDTAATASRPHARDAPHSSTHSLPPRPCQSGQSCAPLRPRHDARVPKNPPSSRFATAVRTAVGCRSRVGPGARAVSAVALMSQRKSIEIAFQMTVRRSLDTVHTRSYTHISINASVPCPAQNKRITNGMAGPLV
jgi:hypothetical protein